MVAGRGPSRLDWGCSRIYMAGPVSSSAGHGILAILFLACLLAPAGKMGNKSSTAAGAAAAETAEIYLSEDLQGE